MSARERIVAALEELKGTLARRDTAGSAFVIACSRCVQTRLTFDRVQGVLADLVSGGDDATLDHVKEPKALDPGERPGDTVSLRMLQEDVREKTKTCRNDVKASDRTKADLEFRVQQLSEELNQCSAREARAIREHEEACIRIVEKDAEIEQLLALSANTGQPPNVSVLAAELAELKAGERTRRLEQKHTRETLEGYEQENKALRAQLYEVSAREAYLETEKSVAAQQVRALEQRVAEMQNQVHLDRIGKPQLIPPLELQLVRAGAAGSQDGLDECSPFHPHNKAGGYQRLHNNVRALNDLLEDTRALRLSSPRDTPRSTGAHTPRSASAHTSASSRSAVTDRHEAATTNVTIRIGIKYSSAGEVGSRQRSQFGKDLVRDLEHASGLSRTSFIIRNVSAGSVVVNLDICSERSMEVAQDLAIQSRDPASPLCGGLVTRKVENFIITSEYRALPPLPNDSMSYEHQEATRGVTEEDASMLAEASDLLAAATRQLQALSLEHGELISDDPAAIMSNGPWPGSPCRRLVLEAARIQNQVSKKQR